MEIVSTPYDDVFRTLLNDCSSLIIPVINEVFGEKYDGTEKIVFTPNEHFLNRQDGEENKIITDTSFKIIGKVVKKYHLECQSTADSSILIRIFEYGTQIALDSGEIVGNVLRVDFPNSAILFLRHTKNTPDKMTVHVVTPGGEVSYDVPVIKVQNYDLKKIFEKNLLFLLPFHIFSHEKRFLEYEENTEKFQKLQEEYVDIRIKLNDLQEKGTLEEYTKLILCEMSKRVVEGIAKNYEKIKKGVGSVMVGKILDYEIKRVYNKALDEGRIEGRAKGLEEGRTKGLEEGHAKGLEEGRAKGLKEGRIEGRIETLTEMVKNVMRSLNVEVNEAMNILKIPEDLRNKIIAN